MKLASYLVDNALTYTEFALLIGTQHARTVERYAKGLSIPNRRMMARVSRATKGAVQPNDFFEIA